MPNQASVSAPGAGPAADPGVADFRLDYESLFHDAPAGYIISREDGTIVEVNQTLLTWLGWTMDELRGTNFHKLLPIGDRILYATHVKPQMGTAGVFGELAVEVLSSDGRRMPALLSAVRSPATDSRPTLDRIIVFNAHVSPCWTSRKAQTC